MLTKSVRRVLQQTAAELRGFTRRSFMARTVVELLSGVPYRAEQELGWNRQTVRKALHEHASSVECVDGRKGRAGRKPVHHHLPRLLEDLRSLMESQCQTDPTFRTTRLYRRLSVEEVRRQLIAQKGYHETQLPSAETLRVRLEELNYHPQRVQKSKAKKRFRKPMPSSSR
jgi:hypothetical protein